MARRSSPHPEAASLELAELLGSTEALLLDLLNASPVGIALVGASGNILIANERLHELCGSGEHPLVGEAIDALFDERFRHQVLNVDYFNNPQALTLGVESELCGCRGDGSEFPAELRLTPLRGRSGVLVRAEIRDITTRRRNEEAVTRAADREHEAMHQLRDVDRLRTEFISTASHELRTPLTVVLGFARMLAGRWESLDDATRIHLVKRIAASGQRLEGLIADMIDFTRAEAGRIDVRATEQQLDELAHDAAYKIRALVDGHTLRVEIEGGIVVCADRAIMGRIFENLLTNAIKYSPPGTNIVIAAQTDTTSSEVIVRVIDDGPGIPEGERERVFERFHRVASEHSAPTGTGIGLTITKAFVEAQGGRIWVEDGPDGGSAFCFTVNRVTPPHDVVAT